jgi:hypothetical protein
VQLMVVALGLNPGLVEWMPHVTFDRLSGG